MNANEKNKYEFSIFYPVTMTFKQILEDCCRRFYDSDIEYTAVLSTKLGAKEVVVTLR